jgi:hypothetical protein
VKINEKARGLQTLDERFIVDVAHMPPSAPSYVRRHPLVLGESEIILGLTDEFTVRNGGGHYFRPVT